jgi:hypothetical protein
VPHLKTETDPIFETFEFSSYLEFQTMEKVKQSSDSDIYIRICKANSNGRNRVVYFSSDTDIYIYI